MFGELDHGFYLMRYELFENIKHTKENDEKLAEVVSELTDMTAERDQLTN